MTDGGPFSGADRWLAWARELQAIGQAGLHFAQDNFDRERYARIQQLAAEIIAHHSNLGVGDWLRFQADEFGYPTPKVDVRGVVFRNDQVLLVQELSDSGRWTLPGGWADVNESPAEAVAREVKEETGFLVVAHRLLAVYDREKQGHTPPFPYHVYKLFFLCDITGQEESARLEGETGRVGFFGEEQWPELSVSRVTPGQLRRFFSHRRDSGRGTEFD